MDHTALIKDILEKLFEAEKRRLALAINDINTANKRIKGITIDGFMFGGQFYMPTNVSSVIAGAGYSKVTLSFQLNKQMQDLVSDNKTILHDRRMLAQVLFMLLRPCQSDREIRNALPECLVKLVPGLDKHPRCDEDGYTLKNDIRGLRQYLKVLPKMHVYAMTKLLY